MTSWVTAAADTICGGLHGQACTIRKGDVMQLIELDGVKRRLIRCQACAAEAAPTTAPPERTPVRLPFSSLKSLANRMPFDWKTKAAGE